MTARLENRRPHAAVNQVACLRAAPLQAKCCRLQEQVSLHRMLEALLSLPGWLCTCATTVFVPARLPGLAWCAGLAAGVKGEVTGIQVRGCDDQDTIVSNISVLECSSLLPAADADTLQRVPAAHKLSLLLASHLQCVAYSRSPAVACLLLVAAHI